MVASPTSWARLVRERRWRRPRARVYPTKAKVGVQASAPNQYWHLDVTVVKAKREAREARLAANRERPCEACLRDARASGVPPPQEVEDVQAA